MNEERPKISAARVASEVYALRAQCLATAKLAELILDDLGYGKTEAATQAVVNDAGECLHPRETRRPAPVMGKPDRFFCGVCEEVVNDEAL